MKFQKYLIFNLWVCVTDSPRWNIDQGMLRSAQFSQFSTYPIKNIDIPDLAVLNIKIIFIELINKIYAYKFKNIFTICKLEFTILEYLHKICPSFSI